MSVTAVVDEAVMNRLLADSTLLALAPGKVHLDVVPENTAEPFVIVNLQHERTAYEQGGPAFRIARLQVKAVGRATDAAGIKSAADRINVLLDGASFAITGHTLMNCQRAEDNSRFAYTERDGPLLWRHQGFDFELWSDPN